MGRKHEIHPYDRAAIREDFSMDIETLITSIAVIDEMHDETPNWLPEKREIIKDIANGNREWLLNKAKQERFIRTVGTLATLDADRLEELVEEKRAVRAEATA